MRRSSPAFERAASHDSWKAIQAALLKDHFVLRILLGADWPHLDLQKHREMVTSYV